MTFTTLTFMLSLALVFGLYWSSKGRVGQNTVVVVASFAFHGWWDVRFSALLLGSILLDFVVASRARSAADIAAHPSQSHRWRGPRTGRFLRVAREAHRSWRTPDRRKAARDRSGRGSPQRSERPW
jgi:hypothetical protein